MKNWLPFEFVPEYAIEEDAGLAVAQPGMEFVAKLIARSIRPFAVRRTALVHEPGDDPMERDSAVKRLAADRAALEVHPFARAFRQTDEVRHRTGRLLDLSRHQTSPARS